MACSRPDGRVVARVNGEAITAADIADLLPAGVEPGRMDTLKQQVLDGVITTRLFRQEAIRQGLDTTDDVKYTLEQEQKALLSKELFDSVTAPGNRLNETEIQTAHKLLQTEARLAVIFVSAESLAKRLTRELDSGAPFETLAARYSVHATAAKGGDMGFTPILMIPEPLRTKVQLLKPGGHTLPFEMDSRWQVVKLLETRPATPPPPPLGEMRRELEFRLKKLRRRDLANKYMEELRRRITYNQKGMDILCKPRDSITPEEMEAPVAYKDRARYVKVARLMGLLARFTPALDTAMKKYAVRQVIEEDVRNEDALARRLDKSSKIRREMKRVHDRVLYQVLYKREVDDKCVPATDAEVSAYYQQNRDKLGQDTARVRSMIRNRLLNEQKAARAREFADPLRARARIEIDEAALAMVARSAAPPPGRKDAKKPADKDEERK
jgi:hypothetical protein